MCDPNPIVKPLVAKSVHKQITHVPNRNFKKFMLPSQATPSQVSKIDHNMTEQSIEEVPNQQISNGTLDQAHVEISCRPSIINNNQSPPRKQTYIKVVAQHYKPRPISQAPVNRPHPKKMESSPIRQAPVVLKAQLQQNMRKQIMSNRREVTPIRITVT